MAKQTNHVLYAIQDGGFRPLISLDADALKDRGTAFAKVVHATTAELRKNDAQGQPHSEFKLVSETREADSDSGKPIGASFVELDTFTFDPKGEPVRELKSIFEKAA